MRNSEGGFTFIETILATGILAFASAAIVSLFVSSMRTQLIARDRSDATILAAGTLEQLKTARHPMSGTDQVGRFTRVWQVGPNPSRTLTVIIYDQRGSELMRCSTVVTPVW